jgi:hypothetical protein
MKKNTTWLRTRRVFSLALFATAFCCVGLIFSSTLRSQASAEKALPPASSDEQKAAAAKEPADLEAFRASVGGDIKAVIIELKEEPGVLRKVASEKAGQAVSVEQSMSYASELVAKQDTVLASLSQFGVRALMRETNVKQVNGNRAKFNTASRIC